jgi:hypothetical protein
MKKTIFASALVLIAVSVITLSCRKTTNTTTTTPPVASNPYGAGNGKVTFYTLNTVPNGVDWTINSTTKHDALSWNGTPNCDQTNTTSFILPAGTYAYSGQQTNGSYTNNGTITINAGQCSLQQYSYNGVGTYSVTVNFYTLICSTINTYGYWNIFVDGQFAGTVSACSSVAPTTCTSATSSQILSMLLAPGTHTWYGYTPTISGQSYTTGSASNPNQFTITSTTSGELVSI